MNHANSFSAEMPYDILYQSSRKEASRKKPIFFIHKYFARRITTNVRMALLGFMSDKDDDILKMIYQTSKRKNITILDPFMGGGTTIFEALRFGCNVIGNDLQPLSLFVTKALVAPINEKVVSAEVKRLEKRVGNKIRDYYQTICTCCGSKADGMYAFHVKKVKTESHCKEHKLFSSFIIAYKKDEFTVVCPKCGKLKKTKFDNGKYTCSCGWALLNPKESYIKNGIFTCPDCNESKKLSDYKKNFEYPFETEIIAIEYYCPHCGSHDYKAPDEYDFALINKAKQDLILIENDLPIPDQLIPMGYNTKQILNHGYKRFRDLFNERQLLCLGMLLQAINEVKDKEVQFWLQLAFSGMLEMNNMFCRYQQNAYKICNIFFNHAYVPITMPVENNVFGTKLGTGTFDKTIKKILRGKKFNTNIYDLAAQKVSNGRFDSIKVKSEDKVCAIPVNEYKSIDSTHPMLRCSDSRNLSFIPDDSVDLVLTDPPYGANVMYSELIDFFHVWNYKSSIAKDIGFITPLSPKLDEIIVNPTTKKDLNYYKCGITLVLSECYKKIKNNGFLVFSFHERNLDSWLAILESVHDAGFLLNNCYPVQSETRTGAHTSNKNSIGIDLMLICQKQQTTYNKRSTFTDASVELALERTRFYILTVLGKLQKVDAELTVPDIQNIAIAKFFSEFRNYFGYNWESKKNVINKLQYFLKNIEYQANNFEVTKRRKGWWSELYKEKWNIMQSEQN